MMKKIPMGWLVGLALLLSAQLFATRAEQPGARSPSFANVAYGSHSNQLLDVYLPAGDGPFGVVVCYGSIWIPAKNVPGRGFDVFFPKQITLANYQTHSPLWGIGLKKHVVQFGVTCYQKYPGHPPEK